MGTGGGRAAGVARAILLLGRAVAAANLRLTEDYLWCVNRHPEFRGVSLEVKLALIGAAGPATPAGRAGRPPAEVREAAARWEASVGAARAALAEAAGGPPALPALAERGEVPVLVGESYYPRAGWYGLSPGAALGAAEALAAWACPGEEGAAATIAAALGAAARAARGEVWEHWEADHLWWP